MAEKETLKDKKLMIVEFRKICNPKNKHITMYYGKDVKEAVNELHLAVDEELLSTSKEALISRLTKRIVSIFGEFDK